MTRFILLSHPRTGSTMLVSSLCRHPQLIMLGEIFNEEDEERIHAIRRIAKMDRNVVPYKMSFSGEEYLKQVIFFPRKIPDLYAIGFKLFYNQANSGLAETAWAYLHKNKDIRIIHLTRENLIASYISLQYALKSGKWVYSHSDKNAQFLDKLTIDPKACERYIQRVINKRNEIKNLFGDHPYMDISYENDLCQNFDTTMRKIQRFVNVSKIYPLPICTIKSEGDFHKGIVANFLDLQTYFENSPFKDQIGFL